MDQEREEGERHALFPRPAECHRKREKDGEERDGRKKERDHGKKKKKRRRPNCFRRKRKLQPEKARKTKRYRRIDRWIDGQMKREREKEAERAKKKELFCLYLNCIARGLPGGWTRNECMRPRTTSPPHQEICKGRRGRRRKEKEKSLGAAPATTIQRLTQALLVFRERERLYSSDATDRRRKYKLLCTYSMQMCKECQYTDAYRKRAPLPVSFS